MELEKAQKIAWEVKEKLSPFCERIEIAGSIRRKKPTVNDIEIVCMPAPNWDMLGEKHYSSNILGRQLRQLSSGVIKAGDRYKSIMLPDGIQLDLFIVFPPAQWGVIYTIRTGPAAFSKWIVTKRKYGGALPSHLRVKDGQLHNTYWIIDTPEELDFFEAIRLDWIAPEYRDLRAERIAPIGDRERKR